MDIDTELLAAWERGQRATHVERALVLLRLALPNRGTEELVRLSVGSRDRALTQLRRRLFGGVFAGHVECPRCGQRLAVEMELPAQQEDPPSPAAFATREGLRFRAPDGIDLEAIADCPSTEEAVQRLLHRCCTSAPELLPETWSAEQVAEIESGLAALEAEGELCVDFTCASCGLRWESALDPAGFLWEEIEAHATRVLRTVHRLASAYGWTECEILALPAARRAVYLQLVDA